MNIEQIAIANYRVLQNATLKGIQPFSVFLGANGSGKTTFIDAIGFLHDSTSGTSNGRICRLRDAIASFDIDAITVKSE